MSLYLVTGGAGFIGSHITTALVARGERVRVLDNLSMGREDNLAHLRVGTHGSGAPVELVIGDVADPAAARHACEGVAGVFHEAAQVSVPQSIEDPLESYRINVQGTLAVLDAARRAGAERFVFAASSAVYGDDPTLPKRESMEPAPMSPYASGKLAGEHLLGVWGRVHGMKTVSLRYFNVFGPRQADDSPYSGVIALFARALLEGRQVTIFGDGEQTRDFVFVQDVVCANLLALETDLEPGGVFNVGRGEALSINDLYRVLAREAGSQAEPKHAPARGGDVRHSRADVARAAEQLGFRAQTDWPEGMAATLAWYRESAAGN